MYEEIGEKVVGEVMENPEKLVPVLALIGAIALLRLCNKVKKINFNAEFSN